MTSWITTLVLVSGLAAAPDQGVRARPAQLSAPERGNTALTAAGSSQDRFFAQRIELSPKGIAAQKEKRPVPEPRKGLPVPPEADPEKPKPFVPQKPLTPAEAKKLEAKKLYVVGSMHLMRKEHTAALAAFQKAFENDPTSLPVLQELVQLCFRLGKEDEGMEYCTRALELDPDNLDLLQLHGLNCVQRGQLDQAVESLRRAFDRAGKQPQEGPRLLELSGILVQLYETRNEPAQSVAVLRAALAVVENPEQHGFEVAARRKLEERKVRLYENLGRALIQAKRPGEAIEVFQRGIEADHDPAGSRLSLGLAEAYLETAAYDKALTELEKCLALQLQNERIYELLERCLGKLGRQNELLPKLAAAAEKDPNNPHLRRFYGEKLIAARQYAKAEEQLLAVGGRPEVLPLLTRLYREMKEPAKLLESLSKALGNQESQRTLDLQIEALGKDPQFVSELAEAARKQLKDVRTPLQFGTKYLMARIARAADNVELAREFYKLCIEERPTLLVVRFELIDVLWNAKRYDWLVEICRAGGQRFPGQFEFHEYHARGLAMLDKTAEALDLLQQIIDKSTDRETVVSAQLTLAWVHQHAKDFAKAEAACQRVITEFGDTPRGPYALYLLSNILVLSGQSPRAEEYLLKLVEADPQRVPPRLQAAANNDLGYLWADEGKNLDRAEKMIRSALAVNPESAAYLDSLGWVLFKQNKVKEAIAELERAVKLEDGEDAVIWDHLGDVYRQAGDVARAKAAWEKALELYKKDTRSDSPEKRRQVEVKLRLLGEAAKPPSD